MIEIFSAVLGFAAPFLPEVLKYFNRKQDNAHELEMMRLQIEKGAAEHALRMEEILRPGLSSASHRCLLKSTGRRGTKFSVIREVMNEYPTRLPA